MDLNSLSNAGKDRKDAEEDANDGDDNDINEDKNEADNKDKNEANNEGDHEVENKDEDDRRSTRTKNTTIKNKFAMTFRDVEDSIRLFNGNEKYSVTRWIINFEEAAELFGWTDIQKMIFAKKSLRDLAKLFIQGERGLIHGRS